MKEKALITMQHSQKDNQDQPQNHYSTMDQDLNTITSLPIPYSMMNLGVIQEETK